MNEDIKAAVTRLEEQVDAIDLQIDKTVERSKGADVVGVSNLLIAKTNAIVMIAKLQFNVDGPEQP